MVVYIKNGETHFNEALLNYVKTGSIAVLDSFFRKGNSDLTDDMGRTLLHYAAESNNVSMTQHFIDNNYDVDAEDNNGYTPLMMAMQNVSLDTAKLLINANANIDFRDDEGRGILPSRTEFKKKSYKFPLKESDLWDHYQRTIKMVLEKLRNEFWNNEQMLISRLRDIECSLVQAVYLRDANMTRLMLENGYSVDERELETGETALNKAVQLHDFENVQVLLEHGASVNTQNKNCSTPISFLDIYTSKDEVQTEKVLKILIKYGALSCDHPKHLSTSRFILECGKLWAIRNLVQYSFGWDSQCLLYALVMNHNPDVFEAVRGKNIDVNSVNNPWKSPVLSIAAEFGKLEKVKFLLEYGADPNVIDAIGRTSLLTIFSGMSDHEENWPIIIRLLLQHGADAQCSFGNGRTVFDLAVERNGCNDRDLLNPIIAHIAMIESRGETISDLIRSKIEETFKTEFETCKHQLETMKNTVLYGIVTLHKLLTKSQSTITKYARNHHELSSKFRKAMRVQCFKNSYYSISLQKRVGKAIHLVKLKEEAVLILNNILKDHNKNYIEILYEIVEYLTFDALKNVCKVYDLQESKSFNLDTLFAS